jgi:ferric-dicitrate binding protein FerR (iron transport regulator)
MTKREDEFTADDAEIAALLREVGSRADPAPEVVSDVHSAVHAEWREVVTARRRRRTVVWATAASVCAVAVGAALGVQLMNDEGQSIATLERASGEVLVAADGAHWSRVSDGQRVAVGDYLRSDAPAALRLDTGVALRIDRGTAFQVVDDDRLALSVGALYVDATPGKATDALIIDTHAGVVRHLGTQYQVRTRVDGIDVSVREGRVVVENDHGESIASAGEHLLISTQGSVQRSRIAATDAAWQWASEVAPPFAIENESLSAFLAWIARETGRSLVYESPQVQSAAADVVLHGSIEGLAPDVALTAVLATTPFRRDETNAEAIEIRFVNAIDSKVGTRPTP